jgi:hypothetical protein
MRRLVDSHDIVLVDAGAIGLHDGSSIVSRENSSAVDVAVIVRDVRRSNEEDVRQSLTGLSECGIPAAALAENFAAASAVEKPSRQAA